MKCSICGGSESSVLESRAYYGGKVVVRRRQCACGNRWTTDEKKRKGSDSLPWAESHPSNSGSNHVNDPPVIAGQTELQPATNGVSRPIGGVGGGLSSDPIPVPSSSGPIPSGPLVARSERIADIMSVYAHYRGHHPRAAALLKATSKEWRYIRARLEEGYSVVELCKAIDGYHADPWHLGENDSHKPFLDLGLILRDAGHVMKGLEMLDKPAPKNGYKHSDLPLLTGPPPARNFRQEANDQAFAAYRAQMDKLKGGKS